MCKSSFFILLGLVIVVGPSSSFAQTVAGRDVSSPNAPSWTESKTNVDLLRLRDVAKARLKVIHMRNQWAYGIESSQNKEKIEYAFSLFATAVEDVENNVLYSQAFDSLNPSQQNSSQNTETLVNGEHPDLGPLSQREQEANCRRYFTVDRQLQQEIMNWIFRYKAIEPDQNDQLYLVGARLETLSVLSDELLGLARQSSEGGRGTSLFAHQSHICIKKNRDVWLQSLEDRRSKLRELQTLLFGVPSMRDAFPVSSALIKQIEQERHLGPTILRNWDVALATAGLFAVEVPIRGWVTAGKITKSTALVLKTIVLGLYMQLLDSRSARPLIAYSSWDETLARTEKFVNLDLDDIEDEYPYVEAFETEITMQNREAMQALATSLQALDYDSYEDAEKSLQGKLSEIEEELQKRRVK